MEKSKHLSTVEADLLFTKIISKKNKKKGITKATAVAGRMELGEFIIALQQISCQLYPSLDKDQALLKLVQDKIQPLEQKLNLTKTSDEGDIEKLMEVLKDKEVLELLGIVHKTLYPYYDHYSDDNGLMKFKNFLNFSKDFGIFPDYLSKSKLYRFFNTLAGFYKENSKKKVHSPAATMENEENYCIDEHLFVELLALCSLEVYYIDPQPSPIEKIIYLVEKMTQSSGPAIFRTQKGRNGAGSGECNDFLLHLKLNYPSKYDSYFSDLTKKRGSESRSKTEIVRAKTSKKGEEDDPLAALFK
ncbi:unnamed protein product [Moneuplotes crassus]|uniref:Uncharacterized protein n=1 Tax=Euplotes crassus TaxID=5936 RepID=A0AAD1XQ33_EUPCR|nr:unnamed protein product [Moneuplotes crassus]